MATEKRSSKRLGPRWAIVAPLTLIMLAFMTITTVKESKCDQKLGEFKYSAELVYATVKYALNSFNAGDPLIIHYKPAGKPDKSCRKSKSRDEIYCEVCFQVPLGSVGRACDSVYPGIGQVTQYSGIDSLMEALAFHFNVGNGKMSPYDDKPLVVVTSEAVDSHVTMHSPDGKNIQVRAWDSFGRKIYDSADIPE